MPWHIGTSDTCPSSKPHAVIKEGDGSVEGCHATEADAKAQLAALYASEEKGMDEQQEKMYDEGEAVAVYSMSATSFADLDAEEEAQHQAMSVRRTADQFQMLVGNIMHSEDIEDKGAAVQALAAEFSGRIGEAMTNIEKAVWTTAYVNDLPDSAFLFIESGGKKDSEGKTTPRSLRHLEYKDANGKIDLPHLRNAISRLGQPATGKGWKGFSASKRTSLQKRAQRMLRNAQKGLLEQVTDIIKSWLSPEPEPESGLMLWKDTVTDQYKWLARYTNNIRDRDSPPEIITAAAHRRFVEMVDNKEAPLPELWLWHVPGSRWGQAQWVAYDDSEDIGFTLAGGTIDKGKEPLAEALMALSPDSIRTSHGMPLSSIVRDPNDPSLIVEYKTREISPLPIGWAANTYTGFSILKEQEKMGIPTEKRQALQEWGLSDEVLALVEQDNEDQAEEAKEAGLESKELEQPDTAKDAETEEEQEPEAPAPLTREEVAEVLSPLADVVGKLAAQVEALSGEVKALKESDEAKIAEKAQLTPAASLMDLLKARAVGSEAAKEDGRSALSKSGPAETEPQVPHRTGIPFVDALAAGRDTQISAGKSA